MRKLVPFLLCLCIAAKAQNFTLGNIIVVRIGDGTTGSLSSAAAPVFLEEYTQTGLFVRRIAMPTAVSGTNKMLTNNGGATAEGTLSLSSDGQYLTLVGYNAAVGTIGGPTAGSTVTGSNIDNSSPTVINRVIGLVDYLGNVNTSTALTDAFDKGNVRSVVTSNGNDFWLCGQKYASAASLLTGGIRYTNLGSTTSTKISNNLDDARTVGIANGQLYATSAFSPNRTISTVGIGLPPTAGQAITNLNGIPDGSQISPVAFVFFDIDPSVPGPDLLYICDDGSAAAKQGLSKYSFDGTTWTARGRIIDDCSGVTGYMDCNGKIALFITSNSNANNKIYKFIDQATYNTTISNDGAAISTAGVATVIVNAVGTNKVFRGIQMAPGAGLNITANTTIPLGNYNKITIKSGASVMLSGNVAIADKFVVESGATLDCGNFIISSVGNTAGYFELQSGATLKIGSIDGITATATIGNIQTCIRRFNTSGIYEYKGTTAQNTGDGLPAIITGKLTLNNSSNIILSSNTKISGTINFNAGRLKTSTLNNLTITSTTIYSRYSIAYAQIAEETSFVDGPLSFESNANTYQFLPIGKGTHFAPIGITPYNSVLKTYIGEYFPALPIDYLNISGGLDHISKLEYWDINCNVTNTPNKDAKIMLYWSPKSVVGHAGDDANALPDLRIAHYADNGSGIKWQIDNAGASGFIRNGNIDYGSIAAKDYATSFSPFTLASSTYRNLLPIQLLKFIATKATNKVHLQWQTTNEIDMDHFTAEQSKDGQNFATLKSLTAKNQQGINQYEVIDEKPFQGLSFYRLAMVGKNGNKEYSGIEKVWIVEKVKMSIYPNPAKNFIYVKLPIADGILTLTDPTGKLLKTFKVDKDFMRLELRNLASGVYYISYEGLSGNMNMKFIVGY